MFSKCEFKSTPAYKNLKRFIHTNTHTNLKTNPIVYSLIQQVYKKIYDTPLSEEHSRYANKNCQLIFDYLNNFDLLELEFEGKKVFELILEKSSSSGRINRDNDSSCAILYNNSNVRNAISLDIAADNLENKDEGTMQEAEFTDEVINKLNIVPEIDFTLDSMKKEAKKSLFSKNIAFQIFMPIKITGGDLQILKSYLKNSYGNSQRCDYGTGHELNFLCFLFCLSKFTPIDIFDSMQIYYFSSRLFIVKFKLESAGSKGVWGVDDYEILSFYIMGIKIGTKILSNSFDIPFVKQLFQFVYCYKKTANLSENSPFLFDILSETGNVIAERVEERIERELFGSFVVMQHFVYSNMLSK
ncbi:Serine/threonine-protein phosphatase 2A activator 2 [Cucumispora dikerogammari]|nr:Serine/threonine-protein phosphatase 2A activator 2 [Cucumispora dikerogammari]